MVHAIPTFTADWFTSSSIEEMRMNSPESHEPEFLFLTINEVCNLRCRHCDYWRARQTSLDTIGLDRQEEILAEFAELSPRGRVVIGGGEPTLDANTYFRVCSVSRRLGLETLSIVNGTTISNLASALRVTTLGPSEIGVSLDGPTAEIHDRMRGCRGVYAQATRALRLLLDARLISGCDIKIYAVGLLTKTTSPLLDEFYDLVLRQIGADKLKLNALQPSFQHAGSDDFFATESQVDADALGVSLARCCEKYSLRLNPAWIRQVTGYFQDLCKTNLSFRGRSDLSFGWRGGFTTSEHICNSYERNIMVDLRGRASLCYSCAHASTPLQSPGDMRRFWEESAALREKMARCNALCGISNCSRREHATLPQSRPL